MPKKNPKLLTLRALASEDTKKNSILHSQTQLYQFYYLILQLTQYLSFYFYIQLIKII